MTIVTTTEAAKRLGKSPELLRRWRMEGNGPKYTKLGPRTVVYDVADLDEWTADRKSATTSAYDDHNLVVGGVDNDA